MESEAIVEQAIADILKIINNAISKEKELATRGKSGHGNQRMIQDKISNIARITLLRLPDKTSQDKFIKTVEAIQYRFDLLLQSIAKDLQNSESTVKQAITRMQQIVSEAKDLKLSGDEGQNNKKRLLNEITEIQTNTLTSFKVLTNTLKSELADAFHQARISINEEAGKQQKVYELEQHKIHEAQKTINETINTVLQISRSASISDFIKDEMKQKNLLNKINFFVETEEVCSALEILGTSAQQELNSCIEQVKLEIQQKQQQAQEIRTADIEEINIDELDIGSTIAQMTAQQFGNYLGERIRLNKEEMTKLKIIIDKGIGQTVTSSTASSFNVNTKDITLQISPDNKKLKNIPIDIEIINGRTLVKIGPCDLSGVGGHSVREQIIQDLVRQALSARGINKTYEEVDISACVAVRGRAQMIKGIVINTREEIAQHANAYIKTANEKTLTHWETRNGPQSFFNDTICAMAICATTSLFEKGIREGTIHSSKDATTSILKSTKLKELFDYLLSNSKERITNLVQDIKTRMLSLPTEREKQGKDITNNYRNNMQEVHKQLTVDPNEEDMASEQIKPM